MPTYCTIKVVATVVLEVLHPFRKMLRSFDYIRIVFVSSPVFLVVCLLVPVSASVLVPDSDSLDFVCDPLSYQILFQPGSCLSPDVYIMWLLRRLLVFLDQG